MFKSAIAATIIAIFCMPAISNAVTGADVVPINWSRFTGPAPSDSLSLKTKSLLQNSAKYFLTQWLDSCTSTAETGGGWLSNVYNFIPDPGQEGLPRNPGFGATILGTVLALGLYDSAVIGRGESVARAQQAKLIKSFVDVFNAGFGNGWQDALWASYCALGAWLVWQDLTPYTKNQVARMLEREADRFNYDPPYCNDCTGDSKAEENAWNAQLLTIAVAMLPNHPRVNEWKYRASQWMLSAYSRKSDLFLNRLVDGKLPREWFTGWNMREEGYVYNHNIVHPDYMTCISENIYSVLFQSLAGQIIPQASLFNFDAVYKCFVDYKFSTPPFAAPGGTIYIPGKAQIYYPQNGDWTIHRLDHYYEKDLFAMIMYGDTFHLSTPASTWANMRVDTLVWRQARFTTGQQYAPGEFDNGGQSPWKLAELQGGGLFATSYILLWLKSHNAIMPVGNWFLASVDTTPPPAPIISANLDGTSSVRVSWPVVTGAGSGTACYRVFRDVKEIACTRTPFWIDRNPPENVTANYTVIALDSNGNESAVSNTASVSLAPNPAASPVAKIFACNRNKVMILFKAAVNPVSARTISNYSISGLSVQGAALDTTRTLVTLTTTNMADGVTYTLVLTGFTNGTLPFEYHAVNDGLIGFWPFDEQAVVPYVLDLSGSGNHGLPNRPLQTDGFGNGALSFLNGDQVDMGRIFNTLAMPFSFSLWIKTTGDSAANLITTKNFYSSNSNYGGAWLDVLASGQISFGFGNRTTNTLSGQKLKTSTASIAKNQWTQVSVVVNSATDVAIYLDGKDAGGVFSGSAATLANETVYEAGYFKLGFRNDFKGRYLHYNGLMDEVRVYNRAMSSGEISVLAGDSIHSTMKETYLEEAEKVSATSGPNPFNPASQLRLFLPKTSNAKLNICDVSGKIIRSLYSGVLNQGKHNFTWNAENDFGQSVASGIYLYRLEVGGKVRIYKTVLAR